MILTEIMGLRSRRVKLTERSLKGHGTRKKGRISVNPTVEERMRAQIRNLANFYATISAPVTVALAQEEGDNNPGTDGMVTEEERRRRKVFSKHLTLVRR